MYLDVPRFRQPLSTQCFTLSCNPSSSLFSETMEDVQEFQESTTIKFEWTLRGLKQLFESRCGSASIPRSVRCLNGG